MLYAHTLMLVAPVDGAVQQIDAVYAPVLKRALQMTYHSGTIDILTMVAPQNAFEAEKLLQQFYNLAVEEAGKLGRQGIDIRVLLDGENVNLERQQSWEVLVAGKYVESDLFADFRDSFIHSASVSTLPVIILPQETDPAELEHGLKHDSSKLDEDEQRLEGAYEDHHPVVALGGTFDHLHAGHKILLTLAGWLCKDKLIIGITGPELLKNKKFAEAMESFDVREQNATQFLSYVFPGLRLQPVMINDVYGPTASDPDIDALVISKETRSGGAAINKVRKEKGWSTLTVYEINIVGSKEGSEADNWADKLSSTQLRKEAMERRQKM